jgi:hypothetical protein
MKNLIAIAVTVLGLVSIIAPENNADAQVVLCGYCCDATGIPRCYVPEMPCGYACYCNGVPGTGAAC